MVTIDNTITSPASDTRVGRRLAARVVGVLAFATLTAIGAKIAVPLPSGIPVTLQVPAVLLAGIVLGPYGGGASQLLYLAAGLSGLPVFAAGGGVAYLVGPTGGYLLAFPLAAGVVGWTSWRSDRLIVLVAGVAGAVALIHAAGMAWLSLATGGALTFRSVVLPFLPGDLLKIALAVLVGSRLRIPVRRAIE